VNTAVPDKKSIMMYVMCLFQSLPHSETQAASLEQDLLSPVPPPLHPNAEVVSITHTSTFQFNVSIPISPQSENNEVCNEYNRIIKMHHLQIFSSNQG